MTKRHSALGLIAGLMVLGILACSFTVAQDAAKASQKEQAEKDYNALLGRIKDGDLTVDFRTFRLNAALAGRAAGPLEFAEHSARERLLASGNYQGALDSARQTLERNYASVYGHLDAKIACQKLNDSKQAAIHEKLQNALADSIRDSGGGKSPETAWFVVNTPEEYFFLRQELHVSPRSQALVHKGGHLYDRVDTTNLQTKEPQSFWFNTDVEMGNSGGSPQQVSPAAPSANDLTVLATAQKAGADGEPTIREGNFNLVQEPPGMWGVIYTVHGVYKLHARDVALTIRSGSAQMKEGLPAVQAVQLTALQIGVCYEPQSGGWDIYAPEVVNIPNITVSRGNAFQFPETTIKVLLPEQRLRATAWLCSLLWGRSKNPQDDRETTGNYPAHDHRSAPELFGAASGQQKVEGPTNEKAKKTYQEALDYLRKHMTEAALDEFKKANKQDGGHCLACQRNMIKYGIQLGDWKTAEAAAIEIVAGAQGDRNVAVAHYQLGMVLMKEGLYKHKDELFARAHDEMTKALSAYANFPDAILADGQVLARLKQDDAARAQFERFVKMKPADDPARQRALRYISQPELARARMAPPFAVTTTDGQRVSLDDLSGKVVLLDFWATWCTPCREVLPHMREIAKRFQGQPLVILSVSLDSDEQTWRDFIEKNAMSWPQYRDGGFGGPMSKLFAVEAIPHTFTIDAEGVLQEERIGDASFEGNLKKLVARAREMTVATNPDR